MFGVKGLKSYIGTTEIEDSQLQFLLDAYLKKIESEIGKELLLNAYQETFKGDGQQCIYLDMSPVFDVIQIHIEDGPVSETEYSVVGNAIYKDSGWQGKYTTVGMSGITYSSLENILVIYRAGYLTKDIIDMIEASGENIEGLKPNFPNDLELLIYEAIKSHINNGGKEIKSYAIDDIKYEYITMNEKFESVINHYRGDR